MGRYDDAEDRAKNQRRKHLEARDEERLQKVYSQLAETREGRWFLWRRLELTQAIAGNAFTGNALTTAFNCGEQNVGKRDLAEITTYIPDGFLVLIKEMSDERRTDELFINGEEIEEGEE